MLSSELSNIKCWACGSSRMEFARASGISGEVTSDSFAITDSQYGVTGELHRCLDCDFLQCLNLENVLSFYEDLEDTEYESGREQRGVQSKHLLDLVQPYKTNGRLLDVGAGSGIMVEQAIKEGYVAEGVEPSRWLHKQALEHELPVHLGVFPHENVKGPFDVITFVDVIEHVPNPVELLIEISKHLSNDGVGLVVTPDVGSITAKIMGWRWWHFRIAHIGYFKRQNLKLSLERAGLEVVHVGRPIWYFPLGYVLERLTQYLPKFLRLPIGAFWDKFTVRLNLHDSLYMVFKKKNKENC
jgi:SAM-dependent methyltransferase